MNFLERKKKKKKLILVNSNSEEDDDDDDIVFIYFKPRSVQGGLSQSFNPREVFYRRGKRGLGPEEEQNIKESIFFFFLVFISNFELKFHEKSQSKQ